VRPQTRYALSGGIRIAYQVLGAEPFDLIYVRGWVSHLDMQCPGEVLVSATVRDLVAGSGITFAERGEHALNGLPHHLHLFAVDST
jgi:hypothetical protein